MTSDFPTLDFGKNFHSIPQKKYAVNFPNFSTEMPNCYFKHCLRFCTLSKLKFVKCTKFTLHSTVLNLCSRGHLMKLQMIL